VKAASAHRLLAISGSSLVRVMAAASLIPELEEVVRHGSAARRAEMLRRITALFTEGASQFNDDHVQLFGDVLAQLASEVDPEARVELSHRLAPISNAPQALVRCLAEDNDIAVARPILKQSQRLEQGDLVELAEAKSQAHLLAVAKRRGISEPVTDILVHRGDREVLRSLAENLDAQLSEAGFRALIQGAAQDAGLAEKIGLRPDIPPRLFRDLMLKSTRAVQDRLLASAKPEMRSEIQRALAEAAAKATAAPRNYSAAERAIRDLQQHGNLDEGRLVEFANRGQFEELVAALAALCEVPVNVVDRLMASDRADPILILCKSAGWGWPTVKAIMATIPDGHAMSSAELDAAFANFERLSPTTAQRVMRFWQVQHWQHAPADE
jgi:uncharacterized protein (DUF2336 family)